MSGRARRLFLVTRFSFLRMARDPVGAIIMVGMPLLVIPILGAIFSRIPADATYLRGARSVTSILATGMVIMFQLFSGRYTVDAARDALLSPKKWRIAAAPCPVSVHALGILGASTVVSVLQGLLLAGFTSVALDVSWGNPLVVVLVILGAALLSQLVHLALLLLTQSMGATASLGWAFAWGSAALGGLVFPLPTARPFWRFMVTWGTPYSLAQTAVIRSAGGDPGGAAGSLAVLFGLAALFAVAVVLLGRRRLA